VIELWRSLRDQLIVELTYDTMEASDKDQTVEAKYTVTNTASPPAADTTEIVFEEIELRIDTADGSRSIPLGSLSPKATVTHVEEIPYLDLIDMKYEVVGSVSPTAFFRVSTSGGHGPPFSMSVPMYLQLLDELSIHQWLESTIKTFQGPGPDTTLAQLSELGVPLSVAAKEMGETVERIRRYTSLATSGHRDRGNLSQHREVLEEYYRDTLRGIADIQQALRSADQKKVSRTVAIVATRLDRRAEEVKESTQRLKDSLNASRQTTSPNPGHSVSKPSGESGSNEAASDDDCVDGGDDDSGRSPNDDRSDSMNPNNDAYQASMDNRSNQMNPNNPAYRSSRGRR